MKIYKIDDMTRGWFIGDFEPSVLRTKDFEVGVLTHNKGEDWPAHYHEFSTEYNLLLKGKMTIQKQELNEGDIFIIEKNEIANPIFLEDCKILVVKTPSVIGDKIIKKGKQ
jgi:quercetin dioxygenase-like cupin family protein